MPYFRISKEFTRPTLVMKPGDVFIENMAFRDEASALEWQRAVNRNNATCPRDVPYKVTAVDRCDPLRLLPAEFIAVDIRR